MLLGAVQQPLAFQVGEDAVAHVEHAFFSKPAEAGDVVAVLVERGDHRQAVLLAQREVLGTGTGGDVHDRGALVLAHLVPGNDAMLDPVLRRQVVEGAAIGTPHQRAAGQFFQHLDVYADHLPGGRYAQKVRHAQLLQRGNQLRVLGPNLRCARHLRDQVDPLLAQVENLVAHAGAHVAVLGMHRGGDVGGQRPRGGGPDQQRLALRPPLQIGERKAHVHRGMGHLLVALGDDLVLRQAGAAARAPGHGVGAAVEPALLVAALEEVPDGVVVLIRHGVVGVVPVHPVAEPLRLAGLDGGVLAHPLLAVLDEAGDAVGLDVALRRKPLLLLYLHLHPQPLAVEAVLVALAVALHGAPAQEQVLVGAPPGVVHAHRVVGSDRPVDERVAARGRFVAPQVPADDAGLVPPAKLLLFQCDEVDARGDRRKHLARGLIGGHRAANLSLALPPGQGDRAPLTRRRRVSAGAAGCCGTGSGCDDPGGATARPVGAGCRSRRAAGRRWARWPPAGGGSGGRCGSPSGSGADQAGAVEAGRLEHDVVALPLAGRAAGIDQRRLLSVDGAGLAVGVRAVVVAIEYLDLLQAEQKDAAVAAEVVLRDESVGSMQQQEGQSFPNLGRLW